jgi:hypothetical protein
MARKETGTPALGNTLAPRPGAGRLIERRARLPIRPLPEEIVRLFIALAPVVDLARLALLGGGRLARRASLAAVPRRDQVLPAGEESPASTVRLRGRIEATGGAGFETPGAVEPALFARTIFLMRSAYLRPLTSYADETRGLDFGIRLGSGELVHLAAEEVRLHDAPRRVARPNLAELGRRGGHCRRSWLFGLPPYVREVAIRAGDTVEVAGVIVREVGPHGEGPMGRGTPLLARLVPAPGSRYLWVRRI